MTNICNQTLFPQGLVNYIMPQMNYAQTVTLFKTKIFLRFTGFELISFSTQFKRLLSQYFLYGLDTKSL